MSVSSFFSNHRSLLITIYSGQITAHSIYNLFLSLWLNADSTVANDAGIEICNYEVKKSMLPVCFQLLPAAIVRALLRYYNHDFSISGISGQSVWMLCSWRRQGSFWPILWDESRDGITQKNAITFPPSPLKPLAILWHIELSLKKKNMTVFVQGWASETRQLYGIVKGRIALECNLKL